MICEGNVTSWYLEVGAGELKSLVLYLVAFLSNGLCRKENKRGSVQIVVADLTFCLELPPTWVPSLETRKANSNTVESNLFPTFPSNNSLSIVVIKGELEK